MNVRIWYPQLDVYDCIRRVGGLLTKFPTSPSIERLYITDFYLANPPLLHSTKMSQSSRQAFRKLKIPRPEKTFLAYPAAPLLFNKMEPTQREAVHAMLGKGLLSTEDFQFNTAKLSERGQYVVGTAIEEKFTAYESNLIGFLVEHFANNTNVDIFALRKSTGLSRVL